MFTPNEARCQKNILNINFSKTYNLHERPIVSRSINVWINFLTYCISKITKNKEYNLHFSPIVSDGDPYNDIEVTDQWFLSVGIAKLFLFNFSKELHKDKF